ncbi:hypothetical protein KAI92_02825 [Candidatus Parcubacteria bacterium]|nr:hypothetical protein [Candidatus Parcubacteria bacterium]
MNKREIKIANSWIHFSQNYFNLAELALREMLGKKYNVFNGIETHKVLAFTPDNTLIATLYNVKHGIEANIKTLIIFVNKKLQRSERIHNSKELFNVLKNKLNLNKIKKEIKNAYLADPKNIDLSFADLEADYSGKWLDNIEKLTDKFQHLEFLKNKIENNFEIEDTDNTVFRYPANSMKIELDYPEIIARFTEDDIKKILFDVYELKNSFNSLGYLLDVHINIMPQKIKKGSTITSDTSSNTSVTT